MTSVLIAGNLDPETDRHRGMGTGAHGGEGRLHTKEAGLGGLSLVASEEPALWAPCPQTSSLQSWQVTRVCGALSTA